MPSEAQEFQRQQELVEDLERLRQLNHMTNRTLLLLTNRFRIESKSGQPCWCEARRSTPPILRIDRHPTKLEPEHDRSLRIIFLHFY